MEYKMKRALPIWESEEAHPDTYARFFDRFYYEGGAVTLAVSADSDYECYINGRLAAFGQYSDMPYDKVCDTVDLAKAVFFKYR